LRKLDHLTESEVEIFHRVSIDFGRPTTNCLRPSASPRNLVVAEGSGRELGRITFAQGLELTILIARKEPRRRAP